MAVSLSLSWLEFVIRHPGLVLVLAGVIGEVIFDWKDMEGKSGRGKKISALVLVVGLAIEFIEAAHADKEVAVLGKQAGDAIERAALVESNNLVLRANVAALELQIAQTKTNIVKIDPINQLVSDIFVLATIQLKGSNFLESPLWGSPAVAWVQLCDNRTNIGPSMTYRSSLPLYSTFGEFSHLEALGFNRVRINDDHGYVLRFHPNALVLDSGFEVTYPPKAIDVLNNLRTLLISVKFIPHDSEVTGGSVFLVLNGSIRMRFDILPQKAFSERYGGLGTEAGSSGFTLIATNGAIAPQPRTF